MFRKLDLFLSSGEKELTSITGSSKGPNRVGVISYLRTETDTLSETLCSLVFRTPNDEKSLELL
jgi:hypothetical protein